MAASASPRIRSGSRPTARSTSSTRRSGSRSRPACAHGWRTELPAIQNQLFDLGSDLATPATSQARHPVPTVQERHIEALERLIDEFNEVVGPLTNFLLPGGSPGAAQLHVARTVCRRAERNATTLARDEAIGPTVLPYLNRLSDALFVMARYENHERGVAEPLWEPGT